MIKKLLFFLALFYCLDSFGATWYVRPVAGGPYGSDNGTSYANAWDGFAAVVWGVSGVNAGDTLKVCGSFVAADYDGGGLAMLSVDQSGVTVDGNCSSDGGISTATIDGASTRDWGLYCADNTTCPNQTWKNISVSNFEFRGFYFRNALGATNSAGFVGTNLSCTDIVGAGASNPQCVSGFGTGATLTNITSTRTSDDSIHWEGDDFYLDGATLFHPGYGQTTNLGDCVQIATQADNAIVRNIYCDHRNVATKQCVIYTLGAGDDNAEISDVTCLFPETGNDTYNTKPLYSDVPNTIFQRNYVLGGYEGIYMLGAGSTARSNVLLKQEFRGIDAVSTVSSGTTSIYNNSIFDSADCFYLNNASGATISLVNNLAMGCVTGYSKPHSATYSQSNNAAYNNTTDSSSAGTIAVTSDPALVGGATPSTARDFRQAAGGSLRRAGLDLNLGNIQDNGNRAFAHPPSIGAWEAASGDLAAERTIRD